MNFREPGGMALCLSHWLLAVTMLCFQLASASISCIGEAGLPVDWFIVYKLPKLPHSSHQYVVDGLGYTYMDSNANVFSIPDKSIKSDKSAVGYTLKWIYTSYRRSGDTAYLMYNDKDPTGTEFFSKGHTKGVLGFDSTSGFWLIHSVPGFPPLANNTYDYPHTGEKYGQSFLCVSFRTSTFNNIGLQLLFNGPAIYDHHLPDSLTSYVPNIKAAIDGSFIETKPYFHVVELTSLKNVVYRSFAKSKYFEADLYDGLVAPFYNTDLLAETWQDGAGKLPSNCSQPTVENVKYLTLMNDPFRETQDHSKWAISKYSGLGLVCIGDINRMTAQFKRGGGTLCMTKNGNVWDAFDEAVTGIEECPSINGAKMAIG